MSGSRLSVLPDGAVSSRGRVLVVDDDFDVLEGLADAVRDRGHLVALATDGRTGLERAVELAAEVIVVDRDVGVLDVRTFLEVLGDNPRTADAHVFVMGEGDPSELAALAVRAEPLVKPLHAQEVATRIDEVIRARRSPPKERELEGDLAQVALFDLLQVFAQNRRTGELRVESEGHASALWLVAGRIVDASASAAFGTRGSDVVGEKALYRTLAQRRGRFVFLPERRPARTRIDAPTSHLLLEAVRRADERATLEDKLPPRGTQLRLVARPRGLDVPSELLESLVAVLDEPRTTEELLDLVPAHDLEVLQALTQLLERGALQTFDPVRRVRFCDAEEVPAMRAAILRLRRPGAEGSARLGVVGSTSAIAGFARALTGIEEIVGAAEPPSLVASGVFGTLGRLRVGGTELELFALPIDAELRPWWSVFLGPSRAVLLLDGEAQEPELRVVYAGPAFDLPSGAVQCLREVVSSGGSGLRRSGEWSLDP
ncbi:MAG: DUF4388 domain-containing protein [Sandaracinus sp.]|nr:DUF4388 domain-containing protein [Sandaracinus sp.]